MSAQGRSSLFKPALLALAMAAGPALAQDRPPAERQTLGELAYALGESHALRQVCRGPGDQYWRDRMLRLTQIEAGDPAFDAAIRERFNTGYAAGQADAQNCGPYSRRAEAAAAARGQALAQKLSTIMRRVEPPPVEPLVDP
jgi:uncharacterized protein (TIGR02301 family)